MKTETVLPARVRGADVWPISVEAYHVLGEAGVIPERTELLYGTIYQKMPKSPLHSYLIQFLQELLRPFLPSGFILRIEQPIRCGDSEPEPDLAIVRGQLQEFKEAHPQTAALVIEICISSAEYDRSKLRAYASAAIAECWLILVPQKQVEIYRQPLNGEFSSLSVAGPGGQVSSVVLPELQLQLSPLFS